MSVKRLPGHATAAILGVPYQALMVKLFRAQLFPKP